MRAYVSVGPDQICHFTDAEGKSGLWYMVQVAGHLLNPVGSEFSATFVGRLVTTLIQVKFMFSMKATKIDKIFTVDLTVTTYCQIVGEGFVNFCGLLRKREL